MIGIHLLIKQSQANLFTEAKVGWKENKEQKKGFSPITAEVSAHSSKDRARRATCAKPCTARTSRGTSSTEFSHFSKFCITIMAILTKWRNSTCLAGHIEHWISYIFPNLIFQHPASFLHFTTFSRKKRDYEFLWAIFSVMNENTQKGQLV